MYRWVMIVGEPVFEHGTAIEYALKWVRVETFRGAIFG